MRTLFRVPKNDDCYTPPWVFKALGLKFDLDVAGAVKSDHVPAEYRYTIEDDSLSRQWFGRVWMNPPFSKILPWVDKFIQHHNGVALLPTSTGVWMEKLWMLPSARWVILEPVNFILPNGREQKGSLPNRCYLIALGDSNAIALRNFGLVR